MVSAELIDDCDLYFTLKILIPEIILSFYDIALGLVKLVMSMV
jgi:hypothetical protein